MNPINLVEFDLSFLRLSSIWLNDKETKRLTLSNDFTYEEQLKFYSTLKERTDYLIFGVTFSQQKIGVAGLKNISGNSAEYWGYIGVKNLWGKGLGKYMIDAMEHIARIRGINYLYLNVSEENVRAIAAYSKAGFKTHTILNDLIKMEKYI